MAHAGKPARLSGFIVFLMGKVEVPQARCQSIYEQPEIRICKTLPTHRNAQKKMQKSSTSRNAWRITASTVHVQVYALI